MILGQKQMIEVTQSIRADSIHYEIGSIGKYYRLKYLAPKDIHFAFIPTMRVPAGVKEQYTPFPDIVKESIDESDRVFIDSEIYARIGDLHPSWSAKGIFYIHFPILDLPPPKAHPFRLILCNSKYTANAIEEAWDGVKARVFYPPLYTEYYDFSKPIQERKFDIVLYSRLNSDKFNYISDFLQDFDDYKIAVVGADCGLELPNNITAFRNATFKKVTEVLADSKTYVHMKGLAREKSSPEHFGQSIVESLASGCKAYVIDRGGSIEIQGVDTFHDYDDMREKVKDVLSNPNALERGRIGRATGVRCYDPQNREEEFESILA